MNNQSNNVINIDESDFNEKVINASEQKLVLVDFWAPWCGPCKQLTPLLEKVVSTSKDRVLLAKLNIDENQQIAAQLRIQSIPAVFAFKNKQPVDAFQGVIPEQQIVEFIEKCLGEKIKKDNSNFYPSIQKMIDEKNFDEAINLLEDFIAENNDDFKAVSLYLECLSSLERFEEADSFIASLNTEAIENSYIKSIIQKIEIKKKNQSGPSLEILKEKFNKDPKNTTSMLDLADKYFAENDIDNAFNLLLNNYFRNKEIVKKKILEFFEALGNENEKTREYRKKFSSIIFS